MEENIALEHLKLDHTQGLYDLTEANREYLREWLPWLDQIKSSSDTRKFIESTITEYSSSGAQNFAVLYQGSICGVVGFHELNQQHKIGSIGYWLAQNYSGNGIITTATRKLLEIGFSKFQLN